MITKYFLTFFNFNSFAWPFFSKPKMNYSLTINYKHYLIFRFEFTDIGGFIKHSRESRKIRFRYVNSLISRYEF